MRKPGTDHGFIKRGLSPVSRVAVSLNNAAGDHCVDVFERADGSFGFEEYRRDHEDGRGWFALHRHGHLCFVCEADALARAKEVVAWLKQGPS